ncbi:hypothetical protein RRG08_057694 [Elysia crispata]|uniref:Uncharacterized protein n=1 Tax=Elysia crispata TaxID=231223 RepID=A0AAE1DXH0_9GAST|nr:hypothetical protein RRG08_057694 [Elysia crispata]
MKVFTSGSHKDDHNTALVQVEVSTSKLIEAPETVMPGQGPSERVPSTQPSDGHTIGNSRHRLGVCSDTEPRRSGGKIPSQTVLNTNKVVVLDLPITMKLFLVTESSEKRFPLQSSNDRKPQTVASKQWGDKELYR